MPIRELEVPPTKEVRDLPVQSWSEWDGVQMVKNAIRGLEYGEFLSAAQLCDAMTRDDRIASAMLTRNEALPSLPMDFEEGKGARAEELVKQLKDEKLFDLMLPDAELVELQFWGQMCGLGLGENVWTAQPDGTWQFKLKVWHPQFVSWRWDTRSYWVSTTDGMVEVVPNNGQWVLFTPRGASRAWMRGLVRSLYVPWLVRQWGWRDWARYSEVYGSPIRKAKSPVNADEADKQRFLREVARLGTETVIRLPRGDAPDGAGDFELELLEATSTGFEGFDRLLQRADAALTIRILGQNLSTEVKGGSFAAAQVHANIRTDILQADAEVLSSCLKQQCLEWWALFNFGDKALAPLPCWNTDPPEDKVSNAEAALALGQAITALVATGAKPDVDAMLEKAGIPVTGPAGDPPAPPQPIAAKPLTMVAKTPKLAAASQGDEVPPTEGEVSAQSMVDGIVESGARQASVLISHDVNRLLACLHQSSSYEELQQRIADVYRGMDPSHLADLFQKASILAELEGRFAILKDL